jgi:Flp pilus assembly pilin Flp
MKYIILAALASVALVAVGSYFSAASKGNRLENAIEAQYEQNQNSLSKLSLSVVEAAQVPGMARDDIKDVVKSAMEGRYGADGSKAVFQSIKEAYPGQIDPSLYVKIQNIIESGRTDFAVEQEKLIGKVQGYKTELGAPWSGLWLNIAGYPKIDLADFKAVKSNYTVDTFKSGVDTGIKLK